MNPFISHHHHENGVCFKIKLRICFPLYQSCDLQINRVLGQQPNFQSSLLDDDNDNYDDCCTMIMMMINDDNCKSVALTEDMGCTVHSKPNFPKLNNGKLAEKDKSAISNKQQTDGNGNI